MAMRCCLIGSVLLLLPALAALPAGAGAGKHKAQRQADNSSAASKHSAIRWKKTQLDKRFRSEGVAIADVNRDGKLDVL
ncbi:MAG TPA: VCBS repeat-containing protein, partial [Gemmataceae bacterium]|nr:VCBS repeat-containing protein [Gemmataceae bacterium]